MTALIAVCMFALLAWVGVLVAPHQPHRTRERLEADPTAEDDCASVTVLIPARDEATSIGRAIGGLAAQGRGLDVIVVDDESSDGTAEAARAAATAARGALELRVIAGRPLPEGWAGKPWALEQGLAAVDRPFVLLLDADIEVARGLVSTLLREARARDASLVSLLAELHCTGFWERLLTPAFVFFFKLLYPFVWSNDPRRRTAAAAGGCMLVRSDALRAIGGFAAIRGALIDDCSLAQKMKQQGPIWLGLTDRVRSIRAYDDWQEIRRMISRSAYAQLRYSPALLAGTVAGMALTYLAPPLFALFGDGLARWLGVAAWLLMALAFQPTLRFYRVSPLWGVALPFIAVLYLLYTLDSAYQYMRGRGGAWKGRVQANVSSR